MKAGGDLLKTAFLNGAWKAYRGMDPIRPVKLMIGPNSIDVTLHDTIQIPDSNMTLDLKDPDTCHYGEYQMASDGFTLFPHAFVLGALNERFDSVAPLSIIYTDQRRGNYRDVFFTQEVHGRSTLGRCGLCIHATAGYGDYGFKGAFTLEIFNVTNRPIIIYPDIKVAQIEFNAVEQPFLYTGGYNDYKHYYGPVAPELKGRF